MQRLFIAFIFFFALNVSAQEMKPFRIYGTIDTSENSVYYFSYTVRDSSIKDSVFLSKGGAFDFKGNIEEPTRLFISIRDKYDPRRVGDFSVYETWVEPGKEHFFHGFKGWKKGRLNHKIDNSSLDSLMRMYVKLSARNRGKSDDSYELDFVKQNLDSYYSLHVLYFMVSRGQHIEEASKLLPQIADVHKNTFLYKKVDTIIQTKLSLKEGGKFPEFQMADISGNLLKLSEINKGKYLLIDFWASWCGPCRKESPYLRQAYKNYKHKGFDILGVSLDMKRDRWLEAIAQDSLLWSNVSDLKGFDNALAKSLYIHSIPDNFLLDPSGKIIARNIRGNELLEILSKLLD